MKNTDSFKTNNLDLIRLFAALEVAISHSISHLKVENISPIFLHFLHFFPGVPIFFFISGFLISKSYENSKSIKEYSKNRVLRIYPGLIMVSIIGILSVYLSGYFKEIDVSTNQILVWFFAQITLIQFYNPEFMRDYGVGVLNGSLWTISVELQFYIIIPILYTLFKFFNERKNETILFSLIVLSMFIHFIYYQYKQDYSSLFIYKLLGVTFIPWLYMFLIGVWYQKYFFKVYHLLIGKTFFFLLSYILIVLLTDVSIGNSINPLLFLLLSTVIFSLAYTVPSLSNILLKGNDISYGVYIYHMVFVNIFIYYGLMFKVSYAITIIVISILIAIISWKKLEQPLLKLKKKTIHNIT